MLLTETEIGFCPVCRRSLTPGVPTYLQTNTFLDTGGGGGACPCPVVRAASSVVSCSAGVWTLLVASDGATTGAAATGASTATGAGAAATGAAAAGASGAGADSCEGLASPGVTTDVVGWSGAASSAYAAVAARPPPAPTIRTTAVAVATTLFLMLFKTETLTRDSFLLRG